MDTLGHVHILKEASNLSMSISKVIIVGKIHLLFFNSSHQSFCKPVLFWLALRSHTDLNRILLEQSNIVVRSILNTLVTVMDFRNAQGQGILQCHKGEIGIQTTTQVPATN